MTAFNRCEKTGVAAHRPFAMIEVRMHLAAAESAQPVAQLYSALERE